MALATIYMVCTYNSIDPTDALKSMNVDIQAIYAITASVCQFYEKNVELWPPSITDLIIQISQHYSL